MFFVGFLCMFTLAFFETFSTKKIVTTYKIKNILSAFLSLISVLIALFCYFTISFFSENKSHELDNELLMFQDWRIYVAMLSELMGTYIARKNYEVNGNNITVINFSLFFSLTLVPLYSYFLTPLFGFNETIVIDYEEQYEFWGFIFIMTLLTSIFVFDKIKNKNINNINNITLLLSLPFILSNSMFLTGKLMQTYNAFFVYAIIISPLFLFFLIASIKFNEFSYFKKEHFKLGAKLAAISMLVIPLNAVAISILAVEFITLLKRVSQIISGVVVDRIHGNNRIISLKDKIIIFTMVVLGFLLYFYRS